MVIYVFLQDLETRKQQGSLQVQSLVQGGHELRISLLATWYVCLGCPRLVVTSCLGPLVGLSGWGCCLVVCL